MTAHQALPVRFPFQMFDEEEPEFEETSAIDCALLGGVTTGEKYSFGLGAVSNAITGYEHVVVVAFRNVKPEPPYDDQSPHPSMAVRNRAHLTRRGTFLITPYNMRLEIVGRWQTSEAVVAINREVVEVTWEYIHEISCAGAKMKPFLLWYHFPYTVPLGDMNMRDAPLQYTAWNLATILMEWKQANAGMGTVGELYSRLVSAGIPRYPDLAVQADPDVSIRKCITYVRERAATV